MSEITLLNNNVTSATVTMSLDTPKRPILSVDEAARAYRMAIFDYERENEMIGPSFDIWDAHRRDAEKLRVMVRTAHDDLERAVRAEVMSEITEESLMIVGGGPRRRGRPVSKEPKSALTAWVPTAYHDRLSQLAIKHDVSVSTLVCRVLAEALAPRPKTPV